MSHYVMLLLWRNTSTPFLHHPLSCSGLRLKRRLVAGKSTPAPPDPAPPPWPTDHCSPLSSSSRHRLQDSWVSDPEDRSQGFQAHSQSAASLRG
eukprot:scaffold3705_cov172-Ochromonas_danica.AAC.1